MTTLELFLYILLAIFVQVALFALVASIRHMRKFRHMQGRMAGLDTEPPEGQRITDMLPDSMTGKTPMWKGLRQFEVAKKIPEDDAGLVCSFYLKAVDGKSLPDFKPGQFLTFQLTVPDPETGADKAITRCYSLSDAPGGDRYRVSIKRVPAPPNKPNVPPGLSSNFFHDAIQEGDVLDVRAPSGHFYLERGNDPVVLVGGGIGITPVLSMLNDTLNCGSKREIWLFYGVRNSAEHAMKAHLEAMAGKHENFHLMTVYSDPLPKDTLGVDYQHQGFIDVNLMRTTLKFQVYDFYICGPRPMMENLIPALEDWGVPDQHIHYEAFGPASITRSSRKTAAAPNTEAALDETPAGSIAVTFARSGKTLTWDGRDDTLLDFAERHGIDMPSGCRGGGCGTCQTAIASGEISYLQAPDFDPDEGSCLPCVCRPKKDLTVEA